MIQYDKTPVTCHAIVISDVDQVHNLEIEIAGGFVRVCLRHLRTNNVMFEGEPLGNLGDWMTTNGHLLNSNAATSLLAEVGPNTVTVSVRSGRVYFSCPVTFPLTDWQEATAIILDAERES